MIDEGSPLSLHEPEPRVSLSSWRVPPAVHNAAAILRIVWWFSLSILSLWLAWRVFALL